MPRGGPPTYTYSLPPIYLAVPGTTILAAQHNTPLEDIAATLNDVWPVNLGGTGGTSPTSAWDAINSRGSNIATASTIDLDTATGPNVHLTGTTTVTTISLGNGRMRTAVADAAFDFTASASLIVNGFTSGTRSVPPGAMITFLGSTLGVVYVSFSTAYNTFEVLSTDAGATAGPILDLYRNSASPAASDTIGQIAFNGKDSDGNKQEYASDEVVVTDPTSGSEDAVRDLYLALSGARTRAFRVGVGQLGFPATQNPSSDPNTLDDYEEGTFTLTAALETPGSSSWSYGDRTGYYTKIGNAVAVSFILTATPTIGSGSGVFIISGFPFTSISGPTQALTVRNVGSSWTWPTGRTYIAASMASGSSTLTIRSMGTATASVAFQAPNMTSGANHIMDASGIILVQ